ncbi:glycosyltransferase [Arthrobacter psychrolactophilus]
MFMRFCRKNGIRVGLFYRDIYWKFPAYKEAVNAIVGTGTRFLYNMDLIAYKYCVDKLYLPSLGMGKFVPHVDSDKHAALPPGGEIKNLPGIANQESFELFYVGGIGGYYKMQETVKAVAASADATMTICTTEDEWATHGESYKTLLNDRITIIHKSGEDLEPYYARASACMLFIEPSVYRSFAAPIKFAEYIGFGKPVIVNGGTNVAEFVQENGNGWVIPFDPDALTMLLDDLAQNSEKVAKVTEMARRIRAENTWAARARQVAQQLT